jgi:hypothetical protein
MLVDVIASVVGTIVLDDAGSVAVTVEGAVVDAGTVVPVVGLAGPRAPPPHPSTTKGSATATASLAAHRTAASPRTVDITVAPGR